MSTSAVGAVLAGGQSRRMGTDKASEAIGGKRMIDHVVAAVTAAGLRPVVAGARRPDVAATFVADPPDVAGPAAGLVAVMRRHPGAAVVLVGTDQPYVRPETLRALLDTPGPLVAPLDGRRQTLCAVYRAEVLPALERLIAVHGNPSLQALFDDPEAVDVSERTWRSWGEDGRSWLSIDLLAGLTAARASWPDPPPTTIR
jgi:molybdopterin-guanine dinucleotide biosynthesis protein A